MDAAGYMRQDDLSVCHNSRLNLKLKKPFINPLSSKATRGVGNARPTCGSCRHAQGAHFISVCKT